jgi:hypothetical protein
MAVINGVSSEFFNKEGMEATETETNQYAEQLLKSQGVCADQNVNLKLVN